MKLLAILLCLLLSAPSVAFAQDAPAADTPTTDAPAPNPRPSKAGLAGPGADTGHLKELIKLLESMSDDDFDATISQAPKKDAQAPQTVSRSAALQSAYSTLAAAEYQQAGKEGPSTAPQETGWAVDLLQWLGNAAINYALVGGQTYVGRGIDNSKSGQLKRKIKGLEAELAKSDDAKQKAELHAQIAGAYEELAAAAAEAPPAEAVAAQKEARLQRLIAALKTMSDDDYRATLAQLPKDSAAGAQAATREAAVKAAYAALASIEYGLAGKQDAKEIQETGWAIDLLTWLGNASINYALNGGQTYVGRKLKDSPADIIEKDLAGLEDKLAKADSPEKKAAVHAKLGADYEKLSALGLQPQSAEERAARKSARLNELADLLQSVSDAEYKEALKHVHGDAAKRPELASRKAVLKSTYVTLAALEYHSGGEKASADLKRISEQDAKDVLVDPETLQETGWFTDMLGIATLGGVGYLVYENQRKHPGHGGAPAFQPNLPPPNPGPGNPTPNPNPNPVIQGGPAGSGVDGLWLMSWSMLLGANPVPCTGTDEVTVTGGKFSYTAHLFCPCYLPPPPPGWVQPENQASLGCDGNSTQFSCTGGIGASGQITGAASGGLTAPWSFSGQCSGGGCMASGTTGGHAATLSGYDTATCPNGNCLPAQAKPLYQSPPLSASSVAVGLSSAKVAGLYASLDGFQTELTGLEVGSPRAGELHQKIGSVYEELAGSVDETAKTKPKGKPKVEVPAKEAPEVKPAETPQPPAPRPQSAEPAQAVEQPQPEPQPTQEDLLRKDMKQMDDLEKEMKGKVQQTPPGQ